MTGEVEPESVVEADRVHDQRVAFPPGDGVTIPGWIRIVRMRATVEEDLAVAVDVPFEQKEHMRRGLNDPPRIRSLARYAGRKTLRLWIVFRQPLARDFFGPRLNR